MATNRPQNDERYSGFNRLWSRRMGSILSDPQSSIVGLGNHVWRLNNRDSFLLEAEGGNPRSVELYYALLNDCTVYTSWDRLKSLITGFATKFVLDTDDELSQLALEWIEKEWEKKKVVVRDMKATLGLSTIIGLTGVELVYLLDDGRVTFDSVPLDSRRLAYVLKTNEDNTEEYYELRILTEKDLFEGEVVPPRKFIIQNYYSVPIDSPYGLGLGQQIWYLVQFKKCALDLWVQVSDRHGMPQVVGKVPVNTSGDIVDQFFTSLMEMASNGTFVIPDDFEINLFEADTGSAEVLIKDLIDYCDRKIKEILLGESQSSSTTLKPGLAAAAEDARAITVQKARYITDSILHTLNETIVRWLVNLNFPGATPPRLIIDSNDPEELGTLANTLLTLSNIGYQVDPDWIEQKTGIPRKKDIEGLGEVITPPPGFEDISTEDVVEEENPTEGLGLPETNPGRELDSRTETDLNPNDER